MIVLPFYGCVLSPVLDTLVSQGRMEMTTGAVGIDGAVYTTNQALQRLRFCRGDIDIPRALRPYCNLPADAEAGSARFKPFDKADIVVLEPHTSLDIFYGPYALHRGSVQTCLLDRIAPVGKEVSDAGDAWFAKGILNQDLAIRDDAAKLVSPALSGVVEDAETARKVLLEAHGARQTLDELVATMRELRDIIDKPIGIVTYVYRYLPDGRPMSWPADFLDNTLEAAKRLNLPVFDSTRLVRQYGVAAALDDSRQFYRPAFYPVAAEAVMGFCQSVIQRWAADKAKATVPEAGRRENLFEKGRAFSADPWYTVRASVAKDAASDEAPASLLPVKLVEDLSAPDEPNTHDIRRHWPGEEIGREYTMSFFAATGERDVLRLIVGDEDLKSRAEALFDLVRGTARLVEDSSSGVESLRAGMLPLAHGWWWCWLSGEFGPAEKMRTELALCTHFGVADYSGDGRSGAWIAGPRLEYGMQPVLDLNERAGAGWRRALSLTSASWRVRATESSANAGAS